MAANHLRQINNLIRTELAREFNEVLELPRGTIIMITKVKTSADLRNATIYISVLPEQNTGSVLAIVNKQFHRIVKQIGPRLLLRCMPKFRICLDETERQAARIETLLDSLK